ncbi:MAG TPA: hypothetical protein VHH90_06115 [Polyangia bacterium]|nr:hypothetical protein [Polyangia bacterium]
MTARRDLHLSRAAESWAVTLGLEIETRGIDLPALDPGAGAGRLDRPGVSLRR